MKCIELTQGRVAIVSDEDFAELAQWRWYYARVGYAARRKRRPGRSSIVVYMHREIMCSEFGQEVDHINRDRLDNRRENLRVATSSQNKFNQGKQANNTSGYKGVSFHKQRGRWVAEIWQFNKKHYLGLFETREAAAKAYNDAALRLHGEFAHQNLITNN